jgi:hypothetical protein
MKRKIRINFSDFWHPDTLEAKLNNPIYLLLAKRFDLEISEQPDFLIYSVFGVNFIKYDCTRIFYTGENKRANYSLCDWAFGFDYSDDPRYCRWPYYAIVDRASLLQPRDVDALFAKKMHFCAFIYSNERATERVKLLDKLSRYKPVDCGGKVRNSLGYRVGDKVAFLQSYKFDITFENESYPGYTTEKLAEAFAGNTVPIYWGNPKIERDFNTDAFVNCHDFRNLDQVVDFVVELDRNDDLYRQYLGAPAFPDGKLSEFADPTSILDRFERIFTAPPQPVAKTARGHIASLLREPRRRRALRKQCAASAK